MKKVKTTLLYAFATALLLGGAAHAEVRSWRINSDTTKKPHFTDINAAMSSSDVVAGDTLYLDTGCVISTNQTLSKSVTLIGTGYASDAIQTAKVGIIHITATNVKIEGVYFTGTAYIQANYATIERCKIEGTTGLEASYATIRQCRCCDAISGKGSTSTVSQGCTIENCIISSSNNYGTVRALYYPTITNNIIWNASTSTINSYTQSVLSGIDGGVIRNNILLNVKNTRAKTLWTGSVVNSTVQNNVMSQDEETLASTYPDNTFLDKGYTEAMSELFTLDSDTSHNRYRLKDGSPAKGAGVDGTDCGVFAGNYPFVDKGYPLGIPVITKSEVGVRAVDGKVSVKQTVVIQND